MRSLFLAAAAMAALLSSAHSAAAAPPVFGYVALYVKDVPRALDFYERAFGLKRRILTAQQEYGELDTGTTRLGFVNMVLIERISKGPVPPSPVPPSGSEIGLVTPDVDTLYRRAVAAGAEPVSAPEKKPWNQVVSYVRDPDGHLVEICSPLP